MVTLCSAIPLCAQAWSTQRLPSASGPDTIQFIDDTTGWITVNEPLVFRTNDGGATWRRLDSNLPDVRIGRVSFVDKERGWALGLSEATSGAASKLILVTSDGGHSWRAQAQSPCEDEYGWYVSLYFTGNRNGWVGGQCHGRGYLAATTDGGESWNTQYWATDEAGSAVNWIHFTDVRNGWAIGQGSVLRTSDGGKHWEESSATSTSSRSWISTFWERRKHGLSSA